MSTFYGGPQLVSAITISSGINNETASYVIPAGHFAVVNYTIARATEALPTASGSITLSSGVIIYYEDRNFSGTSVLTSGTITLFSETVSFQRSVTCIAGIQLFKNP